MSTQDINYGKQDVEPASGVFRGTTIIRRKIDHESPGPCLVPVNLTNGITVENNGIVSSSNSNISSCVTAVTAPIVSTIFSPNVMDVLSSVVPNLGSKMNNQKRVNDLAYLENNSGVPLPLMEDPVSFQPIVPPINSHSTIDAVSNHHHHEIDCNHDKTAVRKASIGATTASNSNSIVPGFGLASGSSVPNGCGSTNGVVVPAACKNSSNKPARFVVVRFQEYTNRWIHSHVSCKDRFMMERPGWLAETALRFVEQPVEQPVEECAIHRLDCHSVAHSCVMPPSMALLENDDSSRHISRCTHGIKACRRRDNLFLTSTLSSESVASSAVVLPAASVNGVNFASPDHAGGEDVTATSCSSRASIAGSPLRQRRATTARFDQASEDNEIGLHSSQSRDNGGNRRRQRALHEDSMTEGDAEAIINNRITDTTPITNKPSLVNPPVSPAQNTSQSRCSPVDLVGNGSIVINSSTACSLNSTLTASLGTNFFSRSFQPAAPASSLALNTVISNSNTDSLSGTSLGQSVAAALPVSAVLPQQHFLNRHSVSIGALDNPMHRYQMSRSRSGSRRNVFTLNEAGPLQQQPQEISHDSSHCPQFVAQSCNNPHTVYPSTLAAVHDWYGVEQRVDARIAGITDMLRGAVLSAIRSEIDPCQMRMKQYLTQLQVEVATLNCTLRQYAPETVYQEALHRQAALSCMASIGGESGGDPSSSYDSLLVHNNLNESSTLFPSIVHDGCAFLPPK